MISLLVDESCESGQLLRKGKMLVIEIKVELEIPNGTIESDLVMHIYNSCISSFPYAASIVSPFSWNHLPSFCTTWSNLLSRR